MNKILVQVYIPSIERTFDLMVPINKKIHRIVYLIEKVVREIGVSDFSIGPTTRFIDRDSGVIYDMNQDVVDSELENGSKIIVI